ncbi:MAG TPA: DUF1028 domain-containing protein, partial [Acidimicrobiia bacterium]|nr:DUF1028 domain-containing protein [Acidimicrobiia bacterium]
LAVGAYVPWARGGVGAVATQAHAEITYGNRGLQMLESGLTPDVVIEGLVTHDEMRSHRQVGIVNADGASATYTGEDCFEHAVGVSGENFAAQGNILSNPDVPEAMAAAFLGSSGRLVDRLFAALAAGEAAGGEKRGMESAALLVVRPSGGYGGNHDRWLDLRIDHSDSPIEDLGGLIDLHTLYFGRTDPGDLLAFDDVLQTEVRQLLDAVGWWDASESLGDNLQNWLGWHNLEERWVSESLIDPVVLGELRKTATA